jgi:hypothetical protein
MEKYSEKNILTFLVDFTCQEKITLQTDIFLDLGIVGDEFEDMIDSYAKKFYVDMTGYLWYFHTNEEGADHSLGGSFFRATYERVTRIPVTPKMLFEIANKGKWEIKYPEHTIPKRRYDLLIDNILILGTFIALVISLIKEYLY